MLLNIALLVLYLGTANAINPDSPPSCSCSSGFIPLPVDVTIPVDRSVPEGLNSTNNFRLQTTFEIFGVLCSPVPDKANTVHAVQLLLHGQTYNTQYWDVTWGGFQNYSYIAYSCARGISSFAYDNIGAGSTVRPASSSHCQLPAAAQVASTISRYLRNGKVSQILTGDKKKYQKVVGIGHSMGSETLNYAVIKEGNTAPFDGLILTGLIHVPQFKVKFPVKTLPASVANPARWGGLDRGYITTDNMTSRSFFYGHEDTFSPTMLQLDELTKDAGAKWLSLQAVFTYQAAKGFQAPVVELVGAQDQVQCLINGAPCNQTALQISESIYFPDSKNFTMIVVDGGHDINYGFAASNEYSIMNQLFQNFVT